MRKYERMRRSPARASRPVVLVASAAAASYTANCALGAAVKVRIVDSSGFHWAHHALYVATCVLGGLAVSSSVWGRASDGSRTRVGHVLAPAALPLALIPAISTKGSSHVLIGLAAAPFFVAALRTARKGR